MIADYALVKGKIEVPDKERLSHVQRLLETPSPYEVSPDIDSLFVMAMRESIAWHQEKCTFYPLFLKQRGFQIEALKTIDDCAKVPFIHANFFKTHEILSIDQKDISIRFISSGTTGQRSQIFFDRWSIGSQQRMVDFIYRHFGWETLDTPVNYVVLGYEPEAGFTLGTAYTFDFLCKYAPMKHVHYALRRSGMGNHEPDLFGCIDALEEYEKEGLPVRLIGFPAYLSFLLTKIRDVRRPQFHLHPDSRIILGGGWKGYAGQQLEKAELHEEVTAVLGIPGASIRSFFGSVEHSVPYFECEYHHLHIPIWSKVYIRDVKTLQPVSYEEPGFLHFVSPYITSVPAHSVLMGDLASLHDGKSCPCRIETDYFEYAGRAGTSKNRTCAAAAAELLKGR